MPSDSNGKGTPASVVVARGVPDFIKTLLYVRAAGRCEFDGCYKNVLEHAVTLKLGNFGETAHIVAFNASGPRGQDGERPEQVHSIENLMLLCPECHHLIDTSPAEYPRSLLERFKREHEERIARLTEIGPDRKTAVFSLKAPIGGQAVAISEDHVFRAVLPRYPTSRNGITVDLGALVGLPESENFLALGQEQIDRHVERLHAAGSELQQSGHLSVFAIAPIPLLVHLGAKLTNKIPADLYQRHRDTEDWTWKADDDSRVEYSVSQRRTVDSPSSVALVLALSGSIPTESLPEPIRSTATIYEITLRDRPPVPTFLRTRADLEGFRLAYQEALGLIAQNHGILPAIDLIPAIPAPIAVLCGRERLPKVHPALRVYDRAGDGYAYKFEVK